MVCSPVGRRRSPFKDVYLLQIGPFRRFPPVAAAYPSSAGWATKSARNQGLCHQKSDGEVVDHDGPNREQLRAHPTRQIAVPKVLENRSIPAKLRYGHFSISLIFLCRAQIRPNAQALKMADSCQCEAHEAFSSLQFTSNCSQTARD